MKTCACDKCGKTGLVKSILVSVTKADFAALVPRSIFLDPAQRFSSGPTPTTPPKIESAWDLCEPCGELLKEFLTNRPVTK